MSRVAHERGPIVVATGMRRRLAPVSAAFESIAGWLAPTILVLLLLWMWAPIVDLALMSVNKQPFRGIPNDNVTSEWYRSLFASGGVGSALKTSIVIGVVVAALVAVAAFFTARAFGKMRRRGTFMLYVLLPIFLPGLVLGFALLIYAAQLGVGLGPKTVTVAHLAWAFPFGFLAMLIATSRLDPRLLEAAADLGASRWKTFRDIELPLLQSGIVASFLFGFLLSFNELTRSIFVSGATLTLPLYIWAQNSSHLSTVPLVYALMTIITVTSLLVIGFAYWLLFRKAEPSRLGRNA